jgi:uncharacterized membrane protein YedE/YeeE
MGVALLVAAVGFSILKSTGLRAEDVYVIPAGMHTFVGGVVFGLGMVIAGGCASGTIWRMGEGYVQAWVALLAFAISSSLAARLAIPYGTEVFLPDLLGWKLALLLVLFVVLLWYAAVGRFGRGEA